MKSGKETRQRAAGPEKSQDRPTHTELTLTENENVTNKEQQEQSSSLSTHDRDNFDSIGQLPVLFLGHFWATFLVYGLL